MLINSKDRTILDVFPVSGESQYIIPIYQRSYSWRSENIETLFFDINNEEPGYYVGNLLVTSSDEGKNTLEIVDGQQRLTTISLMLLGIYHHFLKAERAYPAIRESYLEDDFNEAKSYIRNQLISKKTHKTRLRLLEQDQKIYDSLMKIFNHKNPDEYIPNYRKMEKRYLEILDLISNTFFVKGYDEDSIENLMEFYDKVNETVILSIQVDNLADAFTIFTSFNAKGLPLTLIDLLKSYYLKQSVDKIGEENSIHKWESLLSFFYDSNGEARSGLVTQFLQNNYDTYENENNSTSSITKTKALAEYDKLFNKKGHRYIDELIDRAMIFSSFTNNIGLYNNKLNYTDKMIESLDKISKMEATSVYPIMLYVLDLHKNGAIEAQETEATLDFIVNYFVRRNITLKPKASNLRAKALNAVNEMKDYEAHRESYFEIIKRNLKQLSADDELFKVALKSNIYQINRDTTRLILVDIERAFGDSFDKEHIDNLTDKNDKGKYYWTLEHIMPQTIEAGSEWDEMIESYSLNDDKEQVLEEHVHKLGNLTLTGYNVELSNSTFEKKLNYNDKKSKNNVGLRNGLFLNSSIPDEAKGETFDNKTIWTIDDINRRNDILSKKVIELYPLD